jgi:protein TonB
MATLRIPFVVGSGGLVGLAVFYVLWAFVDVRTDLGELIEPVRVEFTRQIVETTPESTREERVVRDPPPPLVELPSVGPGDRSLEPGTPFVRPQFTRATIGHRNTHGGLDREPIPLVRIEPDYPPRAIARGLEGWVQVQFSIAANGSIKDAFVVAADPPGTFDGAALAAIARWRYQPKVAAGVAVERVGMQTLFRFTLDDAL